MSSVESFHSRDSSIDSTCLLSQSGCEIFGPNPTIRLLLARGARVLAGSVLWVAYAAIRFMRVRSDIQDSVRRSLGSPKAARRWGAGSAAGRSTRFARTLEG